MITIEPTKDLKTILKIVTEPRLWYLHGHVEDPEDAVINLEDLWLLIIKNNEIAGVLQLHTLTHVTANAHIYILPDYHTTGLSVEAVKVLRDFIKNNTTFSNIITSVPGSCVHVIKLMNKCNFIPCGVIKNGMIYHKVMQDIILFQLEV